MIDVIRHLVFEIEGILLPLLVALFPGDAQVVFAGQRGVILFPLLVLVLVILPGDFFIDVDPGRRQRVVLADEISLLVEIRFVVIVVEPSVRVRAAAFGALGVVGVVIVVLRNVKMAAAGALPLVLGRVNVDGEAAAAAGRAGAGPHALVGHPAHLDGFERVAVGAAVQAVAEQRQ